MLSLELGRQVQEGSVGGCSRSLGPFWAVPPRRPLPLLGQHSESCVSTALGQLGLSAELCTEMLSRHTLSRAELPVNGGAAPQGSPPCWWSLAEVLLALRPAARPRSSAEAQAPIMPLDLVHKTLSLFLDNRMCFEI